MSNFGHEPARLTLKQNVSLVLSQVYGVAKLVLNVLSFKHKKDQS